MDNKYKVMTLNAFDNARMIQVFGKVKLYPTDYTLTWNSSPEHRKMSQVIQGVHDHA